MKLWARDGYASTAIPGICFSGAHRQIKADEEAQRSGLLFAISDERQLGRCREGHLIFSSRMFLKEEGCILSNIEAMIYTITFFVEYSPSIIILTEPHPDGNHQAIRLITTSSVHPHWRGTPGNSSSSGKRHADIPIAREKHRITTSTDGGRIFYDSRGTDVQNLVRGTAVYLSTNEICLQAPSFISCDAIRSGLSDNSSRPGGPPHTPQTRLLSTSSQIIPRPSHGRYLRVIDERCESFLNVIIDLVVFNGTPKTEDAISYYHAAWALEGYGNKVVFS
ncbi:hypothetical protein WG66_004280 [Moniliophthora roreri]|nr:hypothetical protein WG66_004280 [Moniliophthora roreri]